ncbi:Uncharacterised protein [Salmonella enterica]|nr:Uncharacterised protein [Salmonella enterica]
MHAQLRQGGWGQHFFYSLISGIIYTIYIDGNCYASD